MFLTYFLVFFTDSEDYDEHLSFLKNNVEPWGKVSESWRATSQQRLKNIYNVRQGGIILQYPALRQPEGYTLVSATNIIN